MFMKSVALAALVAFTEARFGQEQCQPALSDIQGVTSGGQPGQAATIAGGAISNLLAGANPCDQLKTADNIIATLGNGADSVKAAKEFLNCEKNFNPFTQSTPTLCSDATLPTTAELRGVLPKIDPSVGGAGLANQLAATSLTTPFDATGKSIADIFAANGFTNFTTEDAAGNKGSAAGGSAASGNSTASSASSNSSDAASSGVAASSADGGASEADACDAEPASSASPGDASSANNAGGSAATSSSAASNATASSSSNSTGSEDPTATGGGSINNTVSTVAGVDFGLCNPGMIFESGLDNRPATEFTFQAADPKIRAIQEEALNFNIITNRICDELTNQCQSNQAAKNLCAQTKTAVQNLGKVRSTADTWNTMLGFAGQDTNPDNTSTVGEPTS